MSQAASTNTLQSTEVVLAVVVPAAVVVGLDVVVPDVVVTGPCVVVVEPIIDEVVDPPTVVDPTVLDMICCNETFARTRVEIRDKNNLAILH